MSFKPLAEPTCHHSSRVPKGYQFVRKGDVYITSHCRRRTHAAGKTLYVVLDEHNQPIGLRCPAHIYQAVKADHRSSATKRATAVQRRDDSIGKKFKEALVQVFPAIPPEEITKIMYRALEKRSGRVGRAGTIEMEKKVELAVRAHIRHSHTSYEILLREGRSWEEARQQAAAETRKVAALWKGQDTEIEASKGSKSGTVNWKKFTAPTNTTRKGKATAKRKPRKGTSGPKRTAKTKIIGPSKKTSVKPGRRTKYIGHP